MGGGGLVDGVEVQRSGRHVGQAPRRGTLGGDPDHLRHDVRHEDLAVGADALGRRQTEAAGATGELEDTLARPRSREVEHPQRHRIRRGVDVVRVLAPRARDRRPHLMDCHGSRCACPRHTDPFHYTVGRLTTVEG